MLISLHNLERGTGIISVGRNESHDGKITTKYPLIFSRREATSVTDVNIRFGSRDTKYEKEVNKAGGGEIAKYQ